MFEPTKDPKDLEEKVDSLVNEVKISHKVISKFFKTTTERRQYHENDFVVLKTNFENLSRNVAELIKIVRDGNGEKSLILRVHTLEQSSKEKKEPASLSGKEKVALYTTLITGILVIVQRVVEYFLK